MGIWQDLIGTTKAYFKIGLSGVRLKDSSGNLAVRNSADSADAQITASKVNVSGDVVDLNSDAAGAGADWKYTLQRPSTGMAAAVTLTLPPDDGSPSQVLSTDGSGALSWVSAASTADKRSVDTTTLAFGATSPVAMFTLPANAVVETVRVIVDTAFNGAPTMSVGITGTTSKYMGSGDVDLKGTAKDRYETHPGETASGGTEALIITYAAGGASAGSARVEVEYVVPA